MLVLTRKNNESIIIDDNIIVRVNVRSPEEVKVSIDAPRHIRIWREEVYNKIKSTKDSKDYDKSYSYRRDGAYSLYVPSPEEVSHG